MAELGFHNRTPFAAEQLLLLDEHAAQALTLIAKATFDLGTGSPVLAAAQAPLVSSPRYRGAPGAGSLERDAEIGPLKAATDVLLLGHAHAAHAGATEAMVELRVGPLHKRVQVFGDRRWARVGGRLQPGEPQPFEQMPLVWERAFGGPAFDRNPVGVGYVRNAQAHDPEGGPLPNLEDPGALLREPGDAPAPACFAFVSPIWTPRRAHAGTFDETWELSRFPRLPVDFDQRFHGSAPADLQVAGFLRGGEAVEIHGVSPRGPLRFSLPELGLRGRFRLRRDEPREVALALDTVIIDADALRLELVYRGAAAIHRRVHDLTWTEIAQTGGPAHGRA